MNKSSLLDADRKFHTLLYRDLKRIDDQIGAVAQGIDDGLK